MAALAGAVALVVAGQASAMAAEPVTITVKAPEQTFYYDGKTMIADFDGVWDAALHPLAPRGRL